MVSENTNGNALPLDWLVSNVRWFWLILAALYVVAEIFFSVNQAPGRNFVPLLTLVGIALLLNGIYAGMLAMKYFPDWASITATVIDILFALAYLWLMRQHVELLLPILVFPVIMASVRWDTVIGLVAAIPIIVLEGALLLIDGGEITAPNVTDMLNFGVHALTLFVVSAVPGLFMQEQADMIGQKEKDQLDRLQKENEQGKLISEMALAMSSTLNYREVLRVMISLAFSAMVEGNSKNENTIGMVLLFEGAEGSNGDGPLLTLSAGHNMSRRDTNRKVPSNSGLIGRTIQEAETAITHEAQKDKSITSFISAAGTRSAICAPLRAGFDTYGVVLFCTTEKNFYTQEHKSLLTTLCSQAMISLQNAQLFAEIEHEQQRILELEAEARHKLARDLHDGPTQSIAAIAMRLNFIKMVIKNKDVAKAYEEIIKVEEIAQRTTHEIRTMLFTMRPVILETQGLVAALEQYADRLKTDDVFDRVTIRNQGYNRQLDTESEGVIFAIVEEAVGNAKKHSQATDMHISLMVDNGMLEVAVKDNGVGFDVEATRSSYHERASLGLINMDDRAQAIGGHCDLISAPGKGTTVRVQIPLERARE